MEPLAVHEHILKNRSVVSKCFFAQKPIGQGVKVYGMGKNPKIFKVFVQWELKIDS